VEVYAAPRSINDEDGQDRVKAACGAAKYERLVQIKNKYDPANRFRMNQNVVPTA
jgi:FAD/FMN-containing dehydrogenase